MNDAASGMRVAPEPKVIYLNSLFRRLRQGDIRVPAFQRGYVWTPAQVLELLESVYRGFPIGSLLLWRVDEKQLQVDHGSELPLPSPEESYPLSYVLDGLQRLTTLYGAFHRSQDRRFAVGFDLREQRFLLLDDDPLPPAGIDLNVLFDARELLEAQQSLLAQPDSSELLDRSVELHSVFQEYMLPVVTIEGRTVSEVVEIFERVNSTGTQLGKVDFMRAITWSEDFDLGRELAAMQMESSEQGFDGIQDETFVKLLALAAGLGATSERLIELKELEPSELRSARAMASAALASALSFLQHEGILGWSYVPYEGQLLVAAAVHLHEPSLSADQRRVLAAWIRSVSLSEHLRGKPDHYVDRAIADFVSFLAGGPPPRVRVAVTAQELLDRRFTSGKALSAGIANLLAVQPARDLFTGQVIPPELLMREFDSSHFAAVLSRSAVESALGRRLTSSRYVANVVAVTDESRLPLERDPLSVLEAAADAALQSQLIPREAVDALARQDPDSFLLLRAQALAEAVGAFVSV